MKLTRSDNNLNWAIQIVGGNNDLPYYPANPFSCIPKFESPSLGAIYPVDSFGIGEYDTPPVGDGKRKNGSRSTI
jgi:hypothetical protein